MSTTRAPRATSFLAPPALVLAAALIGAAPVAGQELPGDFELGGGVYLFHHQPLGVEGAEANSEIYAFHLDLDRTEGPWRIHVQARWRDTKLRPFFSSTTWLQEAWGSYRAPLGEASSLTLRAGKIYQRLGRFWDGSFFGNLHYFDGLKLDPDFGVEASLRARPGDGGAQVELYAQGFVDSDRVNGALEGRDLEGEEELREKTVGAGARADAPLGRPGGRELRLGGGVSALIERVVATPGADTPGAAATLEHAAIDLEASWGPALAYLEWTRRASGGPAVLEELAASADAPVRGPAGSRASWWLAGVRVEAGPLELRYNVSTARYADGGFREWIHQPGLTLAMSDGVSLLVEYDDWRRDPSGPASFPAPPGGPARRARLDRSFAAVLHLTF